MLEQARSLAACRHYSLMIEAVLKANGFPEAAEWIDQPHIHNELKDIAERARLSDQVKWNALPPS